MIRASKRRRTKAAPAPREMELTKFGEILTALVEHLPGARAAVLIDPEGECVDYGGDGDSFSIRVTAAHLRVVFDDIRNAPSCGVTSHVLIRTERFTYAVRTLPEGYALCIEFGRRAGFGALSRAISGSAHALAIEAGWVPDAHAAPWKAVTVACAADGRPISITLSKGTYGVEVLGKLIGLSPGDRGFQVRLSNGAESTLVRERSYRWFADSTFQLLE